MIIRYQCFVGLHSRGKSQVLRLAIPIQSLDFLATLENQDGINDDNGTEDELQMQTGEPSSLSSQQSKDASQNPEELTTMSDDNNEQPTVARAHEVDAESDEDESPLYIQAGAIKVAASIVKCSFDQLRKLRFYAYLIFVNEKQSKYFLNIFPENRANTYLKN